MTITRDDLHRLVDELPPSEIDHVGELLRQFADVESQSPQRFFRSMGAGEGPSDLGARAKEIVREELGEGGKSE